MIKNVNALREAARGASRVYPPDPALRMFEIFGELSEIPRCSGNEAGAADYVCASAAAHGLEYTRDKLNNVHIRRPADDGSITYLLQAHLDMVCEKRPDSNHDFTADPISVVYADGMLYADGTTLGADNGIGVAAALTLLTDEAITAGLEAVFTVDEETGMSGAEGFDWSRVTARRLINLDSGKENSLIIGCVGGQHFTVTAPARRQPFGSAYKPLKLTVTGLTGGHSGADIHLGRANAVRVMARILARILHAQKTAPMCLVSFLGGGRTNVIPRSCEAVIGVDDPDAVTGTAYSFMRSLRHEFVSDDSNVRLAVRKCARPETMLTPRCTSNAVTLLSLLPDGVTSMRNGEVDTSCNIGFASLDTGADADGEEFVLKSLARSAFDSRMRELWLNVQRIALLCGGKALREEGYPGWTPKQDTPLQRGILAAFRTVTGEEPAVRVVHAGLECGLISAHIPDLDAVSIGPDMYDIHSPDERLSVASAVRIYEVLRCLLEKAR